MEKQAERIKEKKKEIENVMKNEMFNTTTKIFIYRRGRICVLCVFIEKSFDTPFDMGFDSGKSHG